MLSTGICRWLFLLICLSTWTKLIDSKEMRIVCYYTNWSVYRPGQAKFSPQNINPYLCTHLIYAFGGFTKENTLKPFDKYQDIEKGGYAKFTGLKTYNKNLKTLMAIGGWNEGSSRFSSMVASAERRKELVKNAIKFLRQNHFDGLDLDWEYPTFRDGGKSRDRDNYAQLVQELREEFERESSKTGRPRLILTMAVPAGIEYINKGYDVPKLTKYLDWMNILSYDYHSAFEPAVNHHAPLYSLEEDNEYNYDGELNIDYTIKHYLKLGADPSKLVLGIPTYGRSYTLFNPDASEIGSPADGPGDMGDATRENGYLAYYEICEYVKDQDWEVDEPNPKAMGPIAYKENQWVGYDDENIVRKKAEYVAENSLGGIMFWAIDNDDFRGNCHGKPYPLIEAGKEALLNAYGLTEENLISSPTKPTKSSKSKTRTRTRATTEKPQQSSTVTPSSSRRRRIKNKLQNDDKSASAASSKRRKDSARNSDSSTYSSLKIVTPGYTTPAPPATPDMGGAFKCEDEGFFAHPKDCKKYFWCLGGAGDTGIVAHQFTCPAGLYFNKAADSCDYSQNVLCNKKLQKATSTSTTEKIESSSPASSPKPTASSIYSTSRVPPKITAATFRNSYKQTSTTEAYEDEYEYDDDEEEDRDANRRGEPEEDPKVIKELIDLIRKAGGIEELEKQLKFGKGGGSSEKDSTTESVISKSLYERVLSKTSKNTLKALRKTPTSNKNSGGPQDEGFERSEKKDSKVDRGRLQYSSIARQRPSTEKNIKETTEPENDESEDRIKPKKSFRTQSTLEYVNIRRPKSSSTTEANDDNEFSRNKILGEIDEEEEVKDEESEDVTKKSNFPQYVNIRRQRPSTSEAAETNYSSIRRSTTTSSVAANEEIKDNSEKYKAVRRESSTEANAATEDKTNRYQIIRRSTTTPATSTTSNDEITRSRSSTVGITSNDATDTKYKFIRRSTTSSSVDDDEDLTLKGTLTTSGPTTEDAADSKYKFILRSTTSAPNVEEENDVTSRYQTVSRNTVIPSAITASEGSNSTDETSYIKTDSVAAFEISITTIIPEIYNNVSSITTENIVSSTHEAKTESNAVSSSSNSSTDVNKLVTEKKRPVLFQPRPFSVGSLTTLKSITTESTTASSKVSQSNFKFRLRQNSSSNTISTEASIVRSRNRATSRFNGSNRNLNEDTEQDEKFESVVEKQPSRTRKRLPETTHKPIDNNLEQNRHYRPSELADLSSLTAVDLNLRGIDFAANHRRRRPTTISATTTSTETSLDESQKTGSRTLSRARKPIDTSFGKSRRVIPKSDDQINASSDLTATTKKVRGFRFSTPKSTTMEPEIIDSQTEAQGSIKVSPRTRKVIRRFRPTSSTLSTTERGLTDEVSSTISTSSTQLLRKRPLLLKSRQNDNELTANTVSNETFVISSTQSPLLKFFTNRSRFELSKNDSYDDEDDLSYEQTDVLNGEEGENIKLSESNIRESSQINTFDFKEKPGKQVGKFGKSKSEVFPDESNFYNGNDKSSKITEVPIILTQTEPSRILRRKIIRKFNNEVSTTTPKVSEEITENSFGRKRKIIRRLRPTNLNDFETKDENGKTTQKHFFNGQTTFTTTTNTPDLTSKITSKEVKSKRIFRPSFVKKEKPEEDSETNDEQSEFQPNKFRLYKPRTPSESLAVSSPKYKLYSRPSVSTIENDHVEEEYDNGDDIIDDEEGNLEEETDEETDNDRPKYVIYSTSSIKRKHMFESNTNFEDENEENPYDGLKENKSVSSHILKSALNSRNQSEMVYNKIKDFEVQSLDNNKTEILKTKDADKNREEKIDTSTKRYNLLRPQKERPSFSRQKIAISKEEIQSKSQNDLLKSQPTFKLRLTSTVPTVLTTIAPALSTTIDSLESDDTNTETTINDIETTTMFNEIDEQNNSLPLVETTETILITTLPLTDDNETRKSTNDAVVATTEEFKDTDLNYIKEQPLLTTENSDELDRTTTELEYTSTLGELTTSTEKTYANTTKALDESTEKNVTETTTEFKRKSTLRSIKDRPKFGSRRTEFASSTTILPLKESSSRRTFRNKAYENSRVQKPSLIKVPLKPVKFGAKRVTSPLTINKNLYRYSTTERARIEHKKINETEEDEVRDEEEYEENDNYEEDAEKENIDISVSTHFSTTQRTINDPFESQISSDDTKKQYTKKQNQPEISFAKTTESIATDLGIDTKAVKNTNKNLFSKRKMNVPYASTSTAVVINTESSTSDNTIIPSDTTEFITTINPLQTDSTDPNLTTLHHIFAEVGGTETTTDSIIPFSPTNLGKVERLIEVNRIVEVNTKEGKDKNIFNAREGATKAEIPTYDKIGEISRVTLIKIVDGNNETILKNPETNEINDTLYYVPHVEVDVSTENAKVTSIEIAKVEEIPAHKVMQNVNLKNIEFIFKMEKDGSGPRENRQFEIYGDSKVANNKVITNKGGTPEIIDGTSHINIVTPKTVLNTEASTISLQGLFETEKNSLNPSFTANDELLETGRSEFVNVRVLNQDDNVRLDKGIKGKTHLLPIKVLAQNDEEVTMKAHVVEISPKPESRNIKIVPIRVEMSRSVANVKIPQTLASGSSVKS